MTVVVAVVVAVLLFFRVPWMYVGVAAAFGFSPLIGFAVGGGLVVFEILRARRGNPTGSVHEPAFLREIMASVQAGATLRQAVLGSTSSLVDIPVRRSCTVGAPMEDVGRLLRSRLPGSGEQFAIVAKLSEMTGASVGSALRVLTNDSDDAEKRSREQRVSVAQAKYSALVVGIVPLVAAVGLITIRGIPEPGGVLIVVPMVVGGAMMAFGSGIVFAFANRAASL